MEWNYLDREEVLSLSEEEREKYLKEKESARQLKAKLIFVLPLMIVFLLICSYDFMKMIMETGKI